MNKHEVPREAIRLLILIAVFVASVLFYSKEEETEERSNLPLFAYQNIHTKEVIYFVEMKIVGRFPYPVYIYVSPEGHRWGADWFLAHWRLFGERI